MPPISRVAEVSGWATGDAWRALAFSTRDGGTVSVWSLPISCGQAQTREGAVGPRDTSNTALLRISGRSWSLGQHKKQCVGKWLDEGGQSELCGGNSKLGICSKPVRRRSCPQIMRQKLATFLHLYSVTRTGHGVPL